MGSPRPLENKLAESWDIRQKKLSRFPLGTALCPLSKSPEPDAPFISISLSAAAAAASVRFITETHRKAKNMIMSNFSRKN